MTIDQCYYLGRITKPFGLKNQVVLFLDVDDPSQYQALDSLFVLYKGELVPYFIESLSFNGNKVIAEFEDVSRDELMSIVGCELYLPLDLLPKLSGNKFYFHEVVGFDVCDSNHGNIGKIVSVLDYPAQPLFQIDNQGAEILIPVVDDILNLVDRENRVISITAPPGLVELYIDEANKKNSDKPKPRRNKNHKVIGNTAANKPAEEPLNN